MKFEAGFFGLKSPSKTGILKTEQLTLSAKRKSDAGNLRKSILNKRVSMSCGATSSPWAIINATKGIYLYPDMSNHVHSCRILSILVKSCLFLPNPVNYFPFGATPCPWVIINATNGIFIDFISKDRFLAAKHSQRQLQEPFF